MQWVKKKKPLPKVVSVNKMDTLCATLGEATLEISKIINKKRERRLRRNARKLEKALSQQDLAAINLRNQEEFAKKRPLTQLIIPQIDSVMNAEEKDEEMKEEYPSPSSSRIADTGHEPRGNTHKRDEDF